MVILVSQGELNLVSALQYIMSFVTSSPGAIYVNNALKSASVR